MFKASPSAYSSSTESSSDIPKDNRNTQVLYLLAISCSQNACMHGPGCPYGERGKVDGLALQLSQRYSSKATAPNKQAHLQAELATQTGQAGLVNVVAKAECRNQTRVR